MYYPKVSSSLSKSLNINEYQLINLINKRIRELMHGAKPLIEDKKDNYFDVVVAELLSGKIKPSV